MSALPALRHRLLLNFEGQADGIKSDVIIEKVLENLPAFAQGGKDELARLCGLPAVEVLILLRKMRSLDPKPGLRFWTGQENAPPPDVVLRGKPGDWQVEANEAAFPSIRLQSTLGQVSKDLSFHRSTV